MEFMAIGTAVRADGSRRPKKPFTSDLSGQDFAKLIRSGWVPVDLVQGVGAVMRHDDWTGPPDRSWSNQELVGSTQLVSAARQAARESLRGRRRQARRAHRRAAGHAAQPFPHARVNGSEEAHDQLADVFLWAPRSRPSGRRFPGARRRPSQLS